MFIKIDDDNDETYINKDNIRSIAFIGNNKCVITTNVFKIYELKKK